MTEQPTSRLRLTDSAFLDDYLTFAVWQPAYMADWLNVQAQTTPASSACFALQMFLNMELAFEALAKWFFALRDWNHGSEPLLWRFKKTQVKELPGADDYTTPLALETLRSLCDEQVLRLMKQPSTTELMSRGWEEEEITDRLESVDDLLATLRAGLQNRASGGGDMMRGYNNLKHGLMVVREFPELPALSETPAVFMIAKVEKGENGESLVEPLGLHCDVQQLRPLREVSIATCKLIALLLCLLPWYYYTDLSWKEYKAQGDTTVGGVQAIWQKIDSLEDAS